MQIILVRNCNAMIIQRRNTGEHGVGRSLG
jgi:hypothetical protein